MLKRFAITAVALAALSLPALAQDAQTPATADDCFKAAADLAQAAEAKQLGDDKLDKLEEMLTKMETHCDANQFNEAMAVAKDIKTIIDGE